MSQETTYPIARLGFVATHGHKVKDGSQYDKYFPKSSGTYQIVNPNGTVKKTVDEMDAFCRETLADTEKIAPMLRGKTLGETCKKVFNFYFEHCKYKLDKEGVEELRRPKRAWRDGQILARNPATFDEAGIDCDCFSIAVASTLLNLNISCKFRIAKYDGTWQHVYVIVPLPEDPSRCYIIDCVLDQFNEQKDYTDKFDHRMEAKTLLGGIPIARLSGVGSATIDNSEELDRILSGCHFSKMDQTIDGLGETVEANSPMLKHIYDQLVATRDYISKNPNSVDVIGGAKNHLKMLNAAIAKFWTPQREKVLADLERAEEDWNANTRTLGELEDAEDSYMMGLMSDDFETDSEDPNDIEILEGLGKGFLKKAASKLKSTQKKIVDQHKAVGQKFFSNVKTAVKAVDKVNRNIVKNIVAAKKTVDAKVKDAAKKAIVKTKEVAKKAGALIKKFLIMSNPLTLLMRAGFLLAMKENVFHMAERLLPGVLSQSEAAKKNVSESLWKRSVIGYDKVAKVFEAIGGKRSNLEKALKTGRAGKKKGLAGSVGGLGEPYSIAAAVIAAASVILTAVSKMAQAGITRKSAKDKYEHEQKMAEAAAKQKNPKSKNAVDGLGEDIAEPVVDEPVIDEPVVDEVSTPEGSDLPVDADKPESDGSGIMDEIPAVVEEGQKQGWGKKMVAAIKRWFSNRKNKKSGEESAEPVLAEEQADSSSVSPTEVPAIEAQSTSEADAKEAAAWKAADVAGTLAAQNGATEAEAVLAAQNAYKAAGGVDPSQFAKEGATVAELQASALAAAEKAAASKAAYEAIKNGGGGAFASVGKFIKNNPGTTAVIALVGLTALAFAFNVGGIRTKVFSAAKKTTPAPRLSINGFGKISKSKKSKKPKALAAKRVTMM
ncbi:MAG TPA: hypothetical protein VGC65_00215 [Bacteroidia bacterium]|jgi:hypothetical protein